MFCLIYTAPNVNAACGSLLNTFFCTHMLIADSAKPMKSIPIYKYKITIHLKNTEIPFF